MSNTRLIVMAGAKEVTQLVGQQPTHVGVKIILEGVSQSDQLINKSSGNQSNLSVKSQPIKRISQSEQRIKKTTNQSNL